VTLNTDDVIGGGGVGSITEKKSGLEHVAGRFLREGRVRDSQNVLQRLGPGGKGRDRADGPTKKEEHMNIREKTKTKGGEA